MRIPAIIAILACAAFQCGGAYASPAGNTTAQILKLGGGAGQTAAGGAYAVYSGDATAMFGNPAGTAFPGRCSVTAGRSLLFESVNYSAVSAACPAGMFGSFGAGWQSLDYGEIASRDNTGAIDGSFSPSDRVLSGSWAARVWRNLALGAVVKRVSVKIENGGSAYAADAGVLAKFRTFSVGAAVRNMARKLKINDTSEPLPRTLTAGVGASLFGFSLAMDANSSRDASWLSGGAEYAFFQDGSAVPVMLRAGYSTRLRTGGYHYTAGVGIRDRAWSLDYALVPYGDFGLTHHFTAAFSFGGNAPPVERRAPPRGSLLLEEKGPPPDTNILIPAELPANRSKR